MPELPEVETTRKGLEPHFRGRQVVAVEVRRRDLRWPVADNFEDIMRDRRMTALRRIGKYLLLDMEGGWSAIAHLGMSGSFRIEKEYPQTLKKHDHLLLQSESGVWAVFHDPRRFGAVLTCPTTGLGQHKLLKNMGADPLDEVQFTGKYLWEKLQRHATAVKVALMDQRIIAGMGNIYASESLFGAGIDPHKPANRVTRKEATLLVKAIRQVLCAALDSGGSTLRDYVSGSGEMGYFQHRFQVYDRAGEICVKCTGQVQKVVMGGRATYFCEHCQN